MAVKMRLIGGEWDVKMAPENEGIGTTLATSMVLLGRSPKRFWRFNKKKKKRQGARRCQSSAYAPVFRGHFDTPFPTYEAHFNSHLKILMPPKNPRFTDFVWPQK